MVSDVILLRRYAADQNPDAFAELVRRYARLVFCVAVRVTNDASYAEDVSQECFLELARRAGTIQPPLSAWLHTVARNRALNKMRDLSTRRRHEHQAAAQTGVQPEPTWKEISPHVDEALAGLPDELRLPLVMHYLESRTQGEIAKELRVSQPTISRRLEKGVEELRKRLRQSGVVGTAGMLAMLLATHAAEATPPASLVAELGKIGLAGMTGPGALIGSGAAGPGASAGWASTIWSIAKVTLIAALIFGLIWVALLLARGVLDGRRGRPGALEPVRTPRLTWEASPAQAWPLVELVRES